MEQLKLGHQKAFEIFGKMTFAYYTALKPHKEHEYHMELGRFSEVNMEIQKKRQEFMNTLKAGGVGSPRTLFVEVETYKNNLTLEGSSSGPWRVQEHLFTPQNEQEVRNATKGLFNSFASIDACLILTSGHLVDIDVERVEVHLMHRTLGDDAVTIVLRVAAAQKHAASHKDHSFFCIV